MLHSFFISGRKIGVSWSFINFMLLDPVFRLRVSTARQKNVAKEETTSTDFFWNKVPAETWQIVVPRLHAMYGRFTYIYRRFKPKCVSKNPVIFRFYAKTWECKPPVKCEQVKWFDHVEVSLGNWLLSLVVYYSGPEPPPGNDSIFLHVYYDSKELHHQRARHQLKNTWQKMCFFLVSQHEPSFLEASVFCLKRPWLDVAGRQVDIWWYLDHPMFSRAWSMKIS